MEDYIVTPSGLHVNFYILASVYIKDSSSSTSHWLFLYLFRRHTEHFAGSFYEYVELSAGNFS